MKIAELQPKLLSAARSSAPSDDVPYAFSQRVMAHLGAPSASSGWDVWNLVLWRAAAVSTAVMLTAGAWSLYRSQDGRGLSDSLAVALENAVQAPPESAEDLL